VSDLLRYVPSALPAYISERSSLGRASRRFELFYTTALPGSNGRGYVIKAESVPVSGKWNRISLTGYGLMLVSFLVSVVLPVWIESSALILMALATVLVGMGLIVVGGFDTIALDPVAIGNKVLELRERDDRISSQSGAESKRSETETILNLMAKRSTNASNIMGRRSSHADNSTPAEVLEGSMAASTKPSGDARPSDDAIQRTRAWTGLLVIVVSDVVIAAVATWGIVKVSATPTNNSSIVAILASAFTAIATMTTAYFAIRSVANTAQSHTQRTSASQGRRATQSDAKEP
jgi:hypothetical protein